MRFRKCGADARRQDLDANDGNVVRTYKGLRAMVRCGGEGRFLIDASQQREVLGAYRVSVRYIRLTILRHFEGL